ncbi:MAG: hypothetical protein NVSMB27_03360 [Ktedonobacteraceae bacterium]
MRHFLLGARTELVARGVAQDIAAATNQILKVIYRENGPIWLVALIAIILVEPSKQCDEFFLAFTQRCEICDLVRPRIKTRILFTWGCTYQEEATMNQDLLALFEADQADRQDHPAFDTPEYWQLRERDAQRRRRVSELIVEGALKDPEDYHSAAMVFQHGETVQDIWQAYELASKAASMGFARSRWLAAAAMDRWLMYQGKPQKYGTQFVPDGKRYRLWDVDPATTDAERAANQVPSLQEQVLQAERMMLEEAQPPMEKAPGWMKEALERWRREE